ncbi:MAG TPA: aminotransferase class V-fold PLP-dependent enzyme [Planctomycetes bacterium]|nr:aminotransferase class V-fold PLP-dependent enzyme [Planctomycetota bacterium]HIK60484.1 aminotransferase class V-fold PLP-dependent enzyme [Planctomycetota bacterium]
MSNLDIDWSAAWDLDPDVRFLNHGSFGACPRVVMEEQVRLRAELEREPVLFMARRLEGYLDEAREALANFVGADSSDLVFVPNASTGVNAVLRSLAFEAGDELLVTNHGYNACSNAARFVCERAGAAVTVADIPFPLQSEQQVLDAVLAKVTPRTRLLLIDHITSPTGLVLPIARIVRELRERGVETLVDGAHAPGMLELNIEAIGAAYYTGNCHKWLCTPKGSALLHVRKDLQESVRPTVISHGANSPRAGRSRFQVEFDWVGTDDPTAFLVIPTAIEFFNSLVDGGWPTIWDRHKCQALAARELLCDALDVPAPSPPEMIGALASVPLPPGDQGAPSGAWDVDPSQRVLFEMHAIEVPIMSWPAPPGRLLRVSAQLYNTMQPYRDLAQLLPLE